MYIIPLVIFTYGIFVVLWLADLYMTHRCIKEIGSMIEFNPILKVLTRASPKLFYPFKVLEIALFTWGVMNVTLEGGSAIFYVLMGLVAVYAIVVAQGFNVYNQVRHSIKPAIIVFIAILLLLFAALHMYYMEFLRSVKISNALSTCTSDLAYSESQCIYNATKERLDYPNLDLDLPL